MKRLKDEFLNIVDAKVGLKGKTVLEIGCGVGARSIQIAQKCKSLVAIDPNIDAIKTADKINRVENIQYLAGSAEKLSFGNNVFDVVIFTLSFHHVPIPRMRTAIEETVRVSKKRR